MAFQDKTLTCRECGQPFTFAATEQELFQQRGYTNEPRRCPSCRQNRRNTEGSGSYDRVDRQLYSAVCAQCGKEAQVPFQPRGDRPVYCSDCYSRQRSGTRSY